MVILHQCASGPVTPGVLVSQTLTRSASSRCHARSNRCARAHARPCMLLAARCIRPCIRHVRVRDNEYAIRTAWRPSPARTRQTPGSVAAPRRRLPQNPGPTATRTNGAWGGGAGEARRAGEPVAESAWSQRRSQRARSWRLSSWRAWLPGWLVWLPFPPRALASRRPCALRRTPGESVLCARRRWSCEERFWR